MWIIKTFKKRRKNVNICTPVFIPSSVVNLDVMDAGQVHSQGGSASSECRNDTLSSPDIKSDFNSSTALLASVKADGIEGLSGKVHW